MRSKIRRRVLFFVFSALIMVGLMIGVFADYNSDRVGTVVGSKPYDLGDLVVDFSVVSQTTIPNGYYILEVDYDYNFSGNVFVSSGTFLLNYENVENNKYCYCCYNFDGTSDSYIQYLEEGHNYIYIYLNAPESSVYYSNHIYSSGYTVKLYSISDEYDIDIYDNSQDAWASVVSVVTDATDSIINNDLLLLFAAAVPVISFGVGFLIRLKFRG